jgi:chemotaxis protein methyltransferase CheR
MDELMREFLIESQEGLDRMERFDVIFLRNVMLYFSQETRKTLLAGIHNMLAPDGMLFLGSSEQPANPSIWTPVLAGGTCHFRPRQPS